MVQRDLFSSTAAIAEPSPVPTPASDNLAPWEIDDLHPPAPAPRPSAPYVVTSQTSKKAATAIGGMTGVLRRKVLAALVAAGVEGLTDQEICERLGIRGDTERPRRGELRQLAVVEDSGRTRKTTSGRLAVVWTVARHFLGNVADLAGPPADDTSRHFPKNDRPSTEAAKQLGAAGDQVRIGQGAGPNANEAEDAPWW